MADGITRIAVEGFKSIAKRQEIEIAPLTILAGANSSGKSSIMQPLLMLKQTLEATYDPGPLKIDGPNVRFTSTDEFLSRTKDSAQDRLRVEISAGDFAFQFTFVGLEVTEQTYRFRGSSLTLRPRMSCEELQESANGFALTKPFAEEKLAVTQDRFLLSIRMVDPPLGFPNFSRTCNPEHDSRSCFARKRCTDIPRGSSGPQLPWHLRQLRR